MTQAEYREEIEKYEKLLKDAEKTLQELRTRCCTYEQLLEDYHIANEELRLERIKNRENEVTISQMNKVIEQYEKILNRVNITC